MGKLEISELVIKQENDKLLFILSNDTIIVRKISNIPALLGASKAQLHNFDNMGNGILWEEFPQADLSLKHLLIEELLQKYNLKVV
jgi:hypothetical protein